MALTPNLGATSTVVITQAPVTARELSSTCDHGFVSFFQMVENLTKATNNLVKVTNTLVKVAGALVNSPATWQK